MLEFEVPGKWILTGEHTVLRGGAALVFPVPSRSLKVSYLDTGEDLQVDFQGTSPDWSIGFWAVLEKALENLPQNYNRSHVKGRLKLQSNIPVGAGMGASAVLCVGITRWFHGMGWLSSENSLFEFARSLEDLFHGKSSGLDVAVALNDQGLYYLSGQQPQPFVPRWKPLLYLTYSGTRGVTADCIAKVNQIKERFPSEFAFWDQEMIRATEEAKVALQTPGDIETLAGALHRAQGCFQKWDLISKELGKVMDHLREKGALAVKPTGSGDGGFVLSLWRKEPPEDLKSSLIPCFITRSG